MSQAQALDEIRETYKLIKDQQICELDFSDIPNVYCETDKMMRVFYNEGRPRAKYVKGRGY